MTDEVAGCKVIPEDDGLSLWRNYRRRDELKYTTAQLRELVLYLSSYLSRTSQGDSCTALLMGGPRHGEFVQIPNQQSVFQLHTIPPIRLSDVLSKNPPSTIEQTTHTYERFPDIQIMGGVRLPFAIYEHTSLNKHNVDRRAKQLDEKLATLSTQLPIQKEEIHLANAAKRKADTRFVKARDTFERTQKDLDGTADERDQLAYDHGI
jgi:hypothetical protein